jgi:hypothetical protein
MWDFIWHLRGSVIVRDGASDEDILGRIAQLLSDQRKPTTRRDANQLSFRSPFWGYDLGPNWLAMTVYDRGTFRIGHGSRGRRLAYDLDSLHAFLFCIIAAMVFFIFGALDDGLSGGARYATAAFGGLYGVNMVLAWSRVPRAIRKAVAGR